MTQKKGSLFGVVLLLLVFICSTIFFLFRTFTPSTASSPPSQIKQQWYKVETARADDLLNKPIVGNCHICHAYWVPVPRSIQTSKPRFAHSDIDLNHGSNNRCYNCHHIADRNKYTADDGSSIMVQTPEKLCQRCHGLIYQDWLLGTHGKWTGKWLKSRPGDFKTYTCTECHDPHDPFFKYETATPAPVWPDKFIRTQMDHEKTDSLSNFHIDEAAKEKF